LYVPGYESTDWGMPNQPNWVRTKYNDTVKRNFKYDQSTLAAAKTEAAIRGVPIILVYGSSTTRGTQQYLERTLPAEKRLLGDKAVFVYIDTSKYGPNTPIGEWKRKRHDISVYTRVVSVQADRAGKPGQLKIIDGKWGVGQDVITGMASFLPHGRREMELEKRKFKDLPEYKLERLTVAGMRKASRDIHTAAESAHKAEDGGAKTVARLHYQRAIDAADRFTLGQLTRRQVELEKERRELEAKRLTAREKQRRLEQLQEQEELVGELKSAKANTRLNKGYFEARNGNTAEGKELVLQAGRRNPAIYLMPFPGTTVTGSFLTAAMRGNKFSATDVAEVFAKAGKPPYTVLIDDAAETKRRIVDVVHPTRRREAKNEADVEARYKYSDGKRNLVAALDQAAKNKQPLVFEYGMRGCMPCVTMENETMSTIRDQYGSRAVFAYLSGSRAEGRMLATAMAQKLPRAGDLVAPSTFMATVKLATPSTDPRLRIGRYEIVPYAMSKGKHDQPYMRTFLNGSLRGAEQRMKLTWGRFTVSADESSKDRKASERFIDFENDDVYSRAGRA
jgi:hypothetical protein